MSPKYYVRPPIICDSGHHPVSENCEAETCGLAYNLAVKKTLSLPTCSVYFAVYFEDDHALVCLQNVNQFPSHFESWRYLSDGDRVARLQRFLQETMPQLNFEFEEESQTSAAGTVKLLRAPCLMCDNAGGSSSESEDSQHPRGRGSKRARKGSAGTSGSKGQGRGSRKTCRGNFQNKTIDWL